MWYFVNQNSLIKAALDNNINIVESTSMGRLFDAVSALLDVCHFNTYEGQAPIELENLAATTDEAHQLSIDASGDVKGLLENIVYTAEQLPPGDGGICLGQAYLLEHENTR